MVQLSYRLQKIAQLVGTAEVLIDVGTDHGLLPVYLAEKGRVQRVYATDIAPEPLRRAKSLIEKTDTGDKIIPVLTDGLRGLEHTAPEVIVIAGMGGETIRKILSEAPWTKAHVRLILEPQSRPEELRRWLVHNGYDIFSETLVEEAGKLYPILSVRGGKTHGRYSELDYYLGHPQTAEKNNPLYSVLIEKYRRLFSLKAEFDIFYANLLHELEKTEEMK